MAIRVLTSSNVVRRRSPLHVAPWLAQVAALISSNHPGTGENDMPEGEAWWSAASGSAKDVNEVQRTVVAFVPRVLSGQLSSVESFCAGVRLWCWCDTEFSETNLSLEFLESKRGCVVVSEGRGGHRKSGRQRGLEMNAFAAQGLCPRIASFTARGHGVTLHIRTTGSDTNKPRSPQVQNLQH